ncbi:MAG: NAD(+)/NADH kinase [Bulleidia sp.]|nr:NAD(+)/NADH kinase [Bulleidia sp.]
MKNCRFTVVARLDAASAQMKEELIRTLLSDGCVEDEAHPDVVFVVGGDGTFIYAVHMYLDQLDHVRFYGIHTGTLGFYTDFHSDEFDAFLECFRKEEYTEESYPLLEARTSNAVYYGMNEIRIENAARTQEMDIYINGSLFEKYRGTGICVCTQLGSTAYNRSLGGAVAQDGLDIIEMTEISGIHHNKYRSLGAPLLMRMDTQIRLDAVKYEGALLGADSDVYYIDNEHSVSIAVSNTKKVRMLKGRQISWFDRIQILF